LEYDSGLHLRWFLREASALGAGAAAELLAAEREMAKYADFSESIQSQLRPYRLVGDRDGRIARLSGDGIESSCLFQRWSVQRFGAMQLHDSFL